MTDSSSQSPTTYPKVTEKPNLQQRKRTDDMIQSAKPLVGTKFCLGFFLIQKRHKINQEKDKISERLTPFITFSSSLNG